MSGMPISQRFYIRNLTPFWNSVSFKVTNVLLFTALTLFPFYLFCKNIYHKLNWILNKLLKPLFNKRCVQCQLF